jgi:SAM-dependent methyltransferase
MTAAFDPWADFYDIIHTGLDGERDYFVAKSRELAVETLEIGCGTGRLAIPIAQEGIDITGLDDSAKMLVRCRENKKATGRLSGKITLHRGDMCNFDLKRSFPFVFMAYRTFMHALTPEAQRSCLASVRRHLSDDGLFILSTWAARPSLIQRAVGGPFADTLREVARYRIPENARTLVHYHRARYDEHRQLLIEDHDLHEINVRGKIERKHHAPLVRAWTTPREMLHLVTASGFVPETVLGDYFGTPFGEGSTEMIWLLRKA